MDEGYVGSSQILEQPATLDFSSWPPIFVSSTHFDTEDLHELEDDLVASGAHLTYDIHEAGIVLSRVLQKKRARFDLREKGLFTREIQAGDNTIRNAESNSLLSKKRKHEQLERIEGHEADAIVIDDSSTASEEEAGSRAKAEEPPRKPSRHISGRTITVAKTEWFTDSKRLGHVQRLDDYVVYQGTSVESTTAAERPACQTLAVDESTHLIASSEPVNAFKTAKNAATNSILQRAKEDAPQSTPERHDRFGRRKFSMKVPPVNRSSWEADRGTTAPYAHLLQRTTTEHEEGSSSDMPEPPEWVKRGVKYACQRLTPKSNPNDLFIKQLKTIKLARLLTNDEVGVRAYSTSIASLAAYEYKISNPRDILALPGCDRKIANLFVEWTNTGRIKAVENLEEDEDLKILKTFYDIWGVGNTTARDFYFDRGWRHLDDVIEYGWKDLSRVQQIGVKYYEEFLDSIPRVEVEQIGEVIHEHAVKVRDSGIQTMLVGGYRRGKEASGDVDIIVTHPEESATLNLIEDIVNSLEEEDWITHTLIMSLNSTERNQQTLPFRAAGRGHGFDTLDKAMVVWQNPTWPCKEHDRAEDPNAKNPNIHRRVDIIVSPWRTAGCAVVGWSGGTTFERDLRRYAKNVKSLKFDSSGVRDRRNGEVVDMEGYYEWKGQDAPECRAKTMEEAERRVFESFGLIYREPWERCTD